MKATRKPNTELVAYFVTCVLYGARRNERMEKYNANYIKPTKLNISDEILLTTVIRDIVTKANYKILAFNIASDHIHLVIVCPFEYLTKQGAIAPSLQAQIRYLKSRSASLFKQKKRLAKDRKFHLWASKFNRRVIESDKQLMNAIRYTEQNRIKHSLQQSAELDNLINSFVVSEEEAFDL